MKKILIAYDGSDYAKKALLKGKEIAEKFGSSIKVVYVVDDTPFRRGLMETDVAFQKLKEAVLEKSHGMLEEGLKDLKDFSGKVDSAIEFGHPAHKIIEVAEKEDMDLIVMSNRGLGSFQKAMLGSVSHKVLSHSKVSVLIVK
ncbi:universal stress protein [Inediibacterium massiliense]|uniref:universal stress protein n=1 Tax=Inediibacterium massiliense TaxID=1658111 RepID=UPI0006B5A994|nr:universal stress protein [Inediibacterium massiliense]